MRLTCRFEPDNAINLPHRSTGSAQLPVVGQATGRAPRTFRMRRSSHGSTLPRADTDRQGYASSSDERRQLRKVTNCAAGERWCRIGWQTGNTGPRSAHDTTEATLGTDGQHRLQSVDYHARLACYSHQLATRVRS